MPFWSWPNFGQLFFLHLFLITITHNYWFVFYPYAEVNKAQTLGDEIVDAELRESLQPEPDLDYEEYEEEDTESCKEESINLCKNIVDTAFRHGCVQQEKSTPITESPLFHSNFDTNLRCSNQRYNLRDNSSFTPPKTKEYSQTSSKNSAFKILRLALVFFIL